MLCLGHLAYPGQLYFGSQKQNMITIPTKSANYETQNIKFFHNYHIFALEMNYYLLVLYLQGYRSVTIVKLSRVVGLPYLKILLVNPGYLLTLLLGLPWQ